VTSETRDVGVEANEEKANDPVNDPVNFQSSFHQHREHMQLPGPKHVNAAAPTRIGPVGAVLKNRVHSLTVNTKDAQELGPKRLHLSVLTRFILKPAHKIKRSVMDLIPRAEDSPTPTPPLGRFSQAWQ